MSLSFFRGRTLTEVEAGLGSAHFISPVCGLRTCRFAEVRNNEGANPLLANSSSNLALQRFENFGNLLLRQASRFGDVRKNLDLSERLFCLACCFRHMRNPFQQISNQKTVRRRTLLMAELKNVPNEMQPGGGKNPRKTLYF